MSSSPHLPHGRWSSVTSGVLLGAAGLAGALWSVLEPEFVASHLSSDGRLGPVTATWLGIYRSWAAGAAAVLCVTALLVFALRGRLESRLARLVPRALLVGGALVAALLVAEGLLRAAGGEALLARWEHTAAYQRHAQTFRRSIAGQVGASGLRGHPLARPRQPGARRIVVLGDSFVFGFGVGPLQDTFPAVLERELLAALGPGSVQVFNAGEPGASTVDEIGNASWLIPELEPDLVLVGYYLNDIESEALKERFFASRRLLPLISDNVEGFSILWRLMEERLASWLRPDGGRSYTEHLGLLHAELFDEHRQDLERLVTVVRSAGVRVAFVIFPLVQGFADYPLRSAHTRLQASFAELGVPALDLLSVFALADASALVVAPYDPHLNADGLALAGQAAAAFVLAENLLSEP